MSRGGWIGSTLSLLLIAAPAMRADEPPADGPPQQNAKPGSEKGNRFKLGEVTVMVTATLDPVETANSRIDQEQIQEMNQDTVSSAMATLPGVSTTLNNRNEQMIYVRGNDSRQVPLFIDGVPVYIPYDGSMDFARFSTFDLSEIQVAKGFSSVTYGANTLGGAINLVTRRPTTPFEGDIRVGAFGGGGRKAAVNAGANQGHWYLQAGGSYAKDDNFRMSSDFKPNVREDGGARDNSYFTDKRYSLKLGLTPNDSDEYVIGATRQEGNKGQPVSTDLTASARYWQWPTWDTDSVFITTNTALGDKSYLKLLTYFDTFKNTIESYTNATYTILNKTGKSGSVGITGKSSYDDFSHGVKIEVGTLLLPKQNLKAIIQTKTDVHREDSTGAASTANWLNYEDQYDDYGLEDTISLPSNVDLSLGVGWDHVKPVHSGPTYALSNPKSYLHSQVGVFWHVTPNSQLYATFAQKDHFATLKDRYSLKFGTYIANPDLKPERSENWEVGVKTSPVEWLDLAAALFQSNIQDLIQSVDTGVLIPGSKPKSNYQQMQNIGKVEHSGAELSADFKPSQVFHAGVGYTYLDRTNKSNSIRLTGTPCNRATAYVRWEPVPAFYALTSIQSENYLWDNTPVRLGGFTTVDLTLGWKATSKLLIDGGLTNLFDRNYQLTSGYPLPGRTWFVNGRYRF
jgi:iron complex outermembrane recepter protein